MYVNNKNGNNILRFHHIEPLSHWHIFYAPDKTKQKQIEIRAYQDNRLWNV